MAVVSRKKNMQTNSGGKGTLVRNYSKKYKLALETTVVVGKYKYSLQTNITYCSHLKNKRLAYKLT